MSIDGEHVYNVHQRIILQQHGFSSGVPWSMLDRRLRDWYDEKIVPLDLVFMSRLLEFSKAAEEFEEKWRLFQMKRIGGDEA